MTEAVKAAVEVAEAVKAAVEAALLTAVLEAAAVVEAVAAAAAAAAAATASRSLIFLSVGKYVVREVDVEGSRLVWESISLSVKEKEAICQIHVDDKAARGNGNGRIVATWIHY